MSIAHPLGTDECATATRWSIDEQLAIRLHTLEEWARSNLGTDDLPWPGIYIISGFRTRTEQEQLNPFAPSSQHVRCPALAVDIRVGTLPASLTDLTVFAALGVAWEALGGRWGGRFRDPDPNHFGTEEGLVLGAT